MNTENTAPSFPPVDEKESCCSNTSCCGPQSPVTRLTPKVGRNDPCPLCDSGRKYKKCCGQ